MPTILLLILKLFGGLSECIVCMIFSQHGSLINFRIMWQTNSFQGFAFHNAKYFLSYTRGVFRNEMGLINGGWQV